MTEPRKRATKQAQTDRNGTAKSTTRKRRGKDAAAPTMPDDPKATPEQVGKAGDADSTYGGLRAENRVVMRHDIALNLGAFRAAPENFRARPQRNYPALRTAAPPFFSVIVPNFNGMVHLPVLMEALEDQTFRDFEVIVVDDASIDESVAWLDVQYPAVRVLTSRENRGFVASCNAGAAAARGRLLVLLNSDTAPEEGWLAELAKAVCAQPHAAIFASKLLLFDRSGVLHAAGDEMGMDGIARNRGVWEEDRGQYDDLSVVFGGCGGAVAYRREVWDALGGFDEAYWMYLEDADFAFRAQLMGCEAVFVPEARVLHKLSATGGGVLASYYVGRNAVWLIVKNMPSGLLLRNLGQILGGQLRIAADALRHWRGAEARARLRGQAAGIVGLLNPLRQRQLVQQRRVRGDDALAARLRP
jgi:GT2 family glycosyltransferase